MTVNIRFAGPEDAGRCNDFHNQYYGNHRSLSEWQWEFGTSLRDGAMVPFLIAEDDQRIVGTQAMIPVPMVDQEGRYWSAKAEETLVDQEYRRLNLFVRQYQQLLAYAREQGYVSVWGFTGPENVSIYGQLLGFGSPPATRQLFRPLSSRGVGALLEQHFGSEKHRYPRVVRLLGKRLSSVAAATATSAIAAVRSRVPSVPGLQIRTLDRPPETGARLCEEFVRRWGGTTILRDEAYLKWRIFDNPHVRATFRAAYLDDRLAGWMAYSLDDASMGYLVDTLVGGETVDQPLAEQITRVLVDDAIHGLKRAGAIGVRGWHVSDHPYASLLLRVLRSFGFLLIPRGGSFIVHPSWDSVERESPRKPDGWFISRIYSQGLAG